MRDQILGCQLRKLLHTCACLHIQLRWLPLKRVTRGDLVPIVANVIGSGRVGKERIGGRQLMTLFVADGRGH